MPSFEQRSAALASLLSSMGPRVIACSGGLDSLLLSVLSHRLAPDRTLIAHAEGPSVPREASARVREWAEKEHWIFSAVLAGETEDEAYRANPVDRCFFCKSRLYGVLRALGKGEILSGANTDDLGEYRPGLEAARRSGVRHPFIECGLSKEDLRTLCRRTGLDFAELAASPCLASRFYTGTRIEPAWLERVDRIETELRSAAGARVVRCLVRGRKLVIEIPDEERRKIGPALFEAFRKKILSEDPEIEELTLDPEPYRPGRAFVGART